MLQLRLALCARQNRYVHLLQMTIWKYGEVFNLRFSAPFPVMKYRQVHIPWEYSDTFRTLRKRLCPNPWSNNVDRWSRSTDRVSRLGWCAGIDWNRPPCRALRWQDRWTEYRRRILDERIRLQCLFRCMGRIRHHGSRPILPNELWDHIECIWNESLALDLIQRLRYRNRL